VVHVAQEAVPAAVVAVEEAVAVALVEDFGSDDGRVDAIPDRQGLADQGAQSQGPSVGVRVVAFAVGFADAVDAVGVADADDVAAAEPAVVQQSDLHVVTCIEHELRQHDGVLQPELLLHEPCPLPLLPCGGPTIPPYS
jgi:hypothetical protein